MKVGITQYLTEALLTEAKANKPLSVVSTIETIETKDYGNKDKSKRNNLKKSRYVQTIITQGKVAWHILDFGNSLDVYKYSSGKKMGLNKMGKTFWSWKELTDNYKSIKDYILDEVVDKHMQNRTLVGLTKGILESKSIFESEKEKNEVLKTIKDDKEELNAKGNEKYAKKQKDEIVGEAIEYTTSVEVEYNKAYNDELEKISKGGKLTDKIRILAANKVYGGKEFSTNGINYKLSINKDYKNASNIIKVVATKGTQTGEMYMNPTNIPFMIG